MTMTKAHCLNTLLWVNLGHSSKRLNVGDSEYLNLFHSAYLPSLINWTSTTTLRDISVERDWGLRSIFDRIQAPIKPTWIMGRCQKMNSLPHYYSMIVLASLETSSSRNYLEYMHLASTTLAYDWITTSPLPLGTSEICPISLSLLGKLTWGT